LFQPPLARISIGRRALPEERENIHHQRLRRQGIFGRSRLHVHRLISRQESLGERRNDMLPPRCPLLNESGSYHSQSHR
jgi:hypothetical protein